MAINVKAIAKYVAVNNGISAAAAERIIDDAFAYIRSEVQTDEVAIKDFGKFKLEVRAARTGRNPATGQPLEIAEKKVIKFKPATSMKNEVK